MPPMAGTKQSTASQPLKAGVVQAPHDERNPWPDHCHQENENKNGSYREPDRTIPETVDGQIDEHAEAKKQEHYDGRA
jgi:hypothetical protein